MNRNPLLLQESLLKRAHPTNGGISHHTMFCAEVFQHVANMNESFPLKQKRKKHKGRHSTEFKFRTTQGALERIDEESMHADASKQKQDTPHRHSLSDFGSIESIKKESLRVRRSRLEKDVLKLHERLQDELNLHEALENALSGDVSQHLPPKTQKLLADIAVLEAAVVKLEQQVAESRSQLFQERKDRKSAQFCFGNFSSSKAQLDVHNSPLSWDARVHPSDTLPRIPDECQENSDAESIDNLEENGRFAYEEAAELQPTPHSSDESPVFGMSYCEDHPSFDEREHRKRIKHKQEELVFSAELPISPSTPPQEEARPSETLQQKLCPNKLSEEMVESMMDIYAHLSQPGLSPSRPSSFNRISSPNSPFTTSSLSSLSESSSSARSPVIELHNKDDVVGSDSLFDPYRIREKLSWVDIGAYSSALEIRWISVEKQQLEYAAQALRNYKVLVEKLTEVDVGAMTNKQKLAFWINIYNALLMHSHLAYGIPRSELNAFTLMQKASYVIGGRVLTALNIEYQLLRHKPPAHRPQMALLLALHKIKVTPENSKLAIAAAEPLSLFALGCGARSSPLVKIYTPDRVHLQLKAAVHDYVRASVGLSTTGKILVPKLLHSYARWGSMDDASLVEWILVHLPSSQVALVRDCLEQRRHRFLTSRSFFSVVPFDSSFQYLILSSSVLC